MSKQHPVIIYAGNPARAQALEATLQTNDAIVYTPNSMMEALAMHVFYYPDAVVIEDVPDIDFASEVFAHLRSINAGNLLVLSNSPIAWAGPDEPSVRMMPLNSSSAAVGAELLDFIDVELPLETMLD